MIDFEYAAANVPGLEFANHFSEWTYNYHDPVRPYACDVSRYPTPDQQRQFVKAYVDHRPQFPYADSAASTPATGANSAAGTPGGLHATPSTSSIVEFMLDARVPAGGWKEEERKREEEAERRVRELLEETRLWRTANSAQWVAWGVVQAKVTPVEKEEEEGRGDHQQNGAVETGAEAGNENEAEPEAEFDYLSYAQERAYFFLGDCVSLGLVTPEELGEEVMRRIKVVEY